jgi:hypothetical protein
MGKRITLPLLLAAAVAATTVGNVRAADSSNYQQLQKKYSVLKSQMQAMQQQMAHMQKQMAAQQKQMKAVQQAAPSINERATRRAIKRLSRQVMKLSEKEAALEPGNIQVLIAGDVNVQFQNKSGGNSTFYADSSPMIQVRIDKKIFVNTAFDFYTASGQAGGSAADIGAANINYELGDYMTVGGGLITSPIGGIVGNYNPAPWNRWLVDGSLEDNLLPPNELGIWTRGGIPAPDNLGYLTYFLFVSNGPEFIGTSGVPNQLSYDNFTANQNAKTVGGRISYLPIPNVEIGYSAEWASPTNSGALTKSDSWIQAVDFNSYYFNKKIEGFVKFRGGWTWEQVGQGGILPGNPTSPPAFGNNSNGGQIDVAYQPSMCGIKYLDKMMVAFRYDRTDGPVTGVQTSGAMHEQRYSVGLDYWLHSNAVLKFEYEFDNVPDQHGSDAMFMQFAVGI